MRLKMSFKTAQIFKRLAPEHQEEIKERVSKWFTPLEQADGITLKYNRFTGLKAIAQSGRTMEITFAYVGGGKEAINE